MPKQTKAHKITSKKKKKEKKKSNDFIEFKCKNNYANTEWNIGWHK